ncbi:DinB/UmuC family translesion DNA polymerase [Escherichia coli]|uniref:DinB/UmuC family translesion DNA polymerase n=1 Tax=Escherichia coli TaxID=562 RepID=UPI0025A4713E|nr:hypothetical protein [Escherichia coli]
MHQAVVQYAERAAEKLRGERQYCRQVTTFVRTSPFAVKEPTKMPCTRLLFSMQSGPQRNYVGSVSIAGR